ncbi:MAG: outer membrane lipoprotein carrier protein LolA [Marinilabiliaceae bacterium]
MNAKLYAACAIMMFSNIVTANAQGDDVKSEKEARAILDEMSSKVKSCSTIEIDFTAEYSSKRTGDKHASEGNLKVKGLAYALDVNDMVTYSDGMTVYVWQRNNNEVDISDADTDSEGDMAPSKLFGAYKSGYKLRRLPNKSIGGVECEQVDLYPLDKKTNVMRLRISVAKESRRIQRFEQSTKSGETLTVIIKGYRVNQPIPNSAFTFDVNAHKGVEVVDLR